MGLEMDELKWQARLLKPRMPWSGGSVRPAELSSGLSEEMFRRENLLEDVNYNKIVPNRFLVELSPENYARNYKPIEANIIQQWQEKLLDDLLTTNSRQGRKEYRLGGRLQIQIRPVDGLKDHEARILSRIQSDSTRSTQEPASLEESAVGYLEALPSGPRWALKPGRTVIGRGSGADIIFDFPQVVEKRLVSKRHATIECDPDRCLIYDGIPGGKPSANGTYVNGRQVTMSGQLLLPGDKIVLAALDPERPREDTPGIVVLRFTRPGEA